MLSAISSQLTGDVIVANARMSSMRADVDLLTCREVARVYRVHVETVRRWVRKGAIDVVRVGPHQRIRIRKAEADKHFVDVRL